MTGTVASDRLGNRARQFLALTKPRVVSLIVFTAMIGMLLAHPGAVPLETYDLPKRCVLLFGQEGPGLSEPARAQADAVCSIAQFGSTRSINASAAAAIAMHAWVRRHVFNQRPADQRPADQRPAGGPD